ncbi:MAG: tetratricopeptide repeat protein [Elusimicrobiaceae bacterium]|nr:tetratricopeptide repeat protein [Elusimicrobiaceae bacterium]
MRFSKPFFLNLYGLLILCPAVAFGAGKAKDEQITQCLERGKNFFAAQQYAQAQEAFTSCVRLDPHNAEAQLSLGGVLLTKEDLDGAEKAFQAALKEMTRTSPYLSYTYSMLGDIALKRQENDQALTWYSKSLESNAANVNSLVGKGVIIEYQGDKKGAASFYRSALAVEPLNLIARQRLINLEPEYFSDAEILEALKQRYAIKPDVTVLTDDMRDTFTFIHRAEQRRGVDYLKNKYPKMPADYLVTINKGTEFERDMLTLTGYEVLRKDVGQDAIAVFRQLGVPVKDVFNLRDLKGGKLFKEDNTLTDSGYFAYTQALKKHKVFLLPNESVAPTKEMLEQLARKEEELKKAGYIEISRRELRMIERETKCSEDTLRAEMGLYILPVNKTKRRYFIVGRQTPDPKKSVPYHFLMKEQAKKNPSIKVPANSLVDSYTYYGYTICLEDGSLM